ncbi:MAG: hypothetical protein KGL78_09740 [Burkholderiales bacterium]|nr:hypothetical protein [Burkholderiales bacterium]
MAERASSRPPPALDVARYRPLGRRRRLFALLLAVATAATLSWLLLEPGAQRKRTTAQAAHACAAGQTSGCVGGKVDVIVPASAAHAASR